jgi:uncharacterized protein DUF3153
MIAGGNARSLFRATAVAVALIVATAACQIDVNLTTKVSRDGSGDFRLQFVVDKELVDLARNSGEDPFAALGAIPEELTQAGWKINRSTEGGGLVVNVERPFSDTDDLNKALEALDEAQAAQDGPTAQFFRMRITRSSSFLRTRTQIRGSIDLTSSGLLGSADLPAETSQQLASLIEQAAGEFFKFMLRVELPGSVADTSGDPERIDGGVAEWSPRLGRMLQFSASSSAYNTLGLAAIGIPVLLLIALVIGLVIRRRRPAPVATPVVPPLSSEPSAPAPQPDPFEPAP